MKHLRAVFGILALLCATAALNVLVLKEEFFIAPVLVPLALGGLLALVWLALTFTRLVNAYGKGRTLHGVNTVIASALFLGICVVAYAFTRHLDRSWDLTQEGRRELAPQTLQVLTNLDQDVSVLCLFTKTKDAMGDAAKDKTLRFLERCMKHTAHLDVEIIDPQVDAAKVNALKIERQSPQGTVVLRCGTRQKVIPLSGVTARLEEYDFTNALINVIRDSEPKVYFLTGHQERDIANTGAKDGASLFNTALRNESYQTARLAISMSDPRIPSDCGVLVIFNILSDLQSRETQAIQEYMDRGGRLLILLDPWMVAPAYEKTVQQLLPWLAQRYGIVVGEDLVWSKSSQAGVHLVSDISMLDFEPPDDVAARGSFDATHPVTRGFDQQMAFAGARSVTLATNMPNGVAGNVLLRALPDSWAETDLTFYKEKRQPTQEPGEISGRFGLGVAVTAKTNVPVGDSGQTRDARLIVVGNSVFASNDQLAIAGHRNFVMNAMAWLTDNEDLIAIRPTGTLPQPLLLTAGQSKFIAWLAVLGPLQVIAAAGLVVFLLRRKYQ